MNRRRQHLIARGDANAVDEAFEVDATGSMTPENDTKLRDFAKCVVLST